MKNSISLVLILTLILTVFTGCSTDPVNEENSEAKSKTDLVVWASSPLVVNYKSLLAVNPKDERALITQNIVTEFEAANPDVKIKLVFKDWGDKLNANLLKAVKSNEYMDIVPGEQYIKAYIENGYFSEIDLGEYKDKIITNALSIGTKNAKIYAVPVFTGLFGLVVNKNVLKETGIIDNNEKTNTKYTTKGINPLAPAYWEDLLEICQDIKSYYISKETDSKGGMLLDNVRGGSAWRALAYMRTAGGEFIDADYNFLLNSAANIKAFKMMRDLQKTSPLNSIQATNEVTIYNYLSNNDAAYLVDNVDAIINSKSKPAEGQLVMSEIPTFKPAGGVSYKKSNVLVGTVYYSIMKNSKNKELATKFIKLMLKDENQKSYLKTEYRIPVIQNVFNSEDIKTEEYHYNEMKVLYKCLNDKNQVFNGGIPSLEKNTGLVWEEWDSFMGKVFTSSTDIKTLADISNDSLNAIKNRP